MKGVPAMILPKKIDIAALELAVLLDSSPDAILSITLDSIITNWNTAAERLYGYTAEVVGKSISILMPHEHSDDLRLIMERLKRGESIDRYETAHRHKDGSLLDISLIISPVKSQEGKIIGALAIAHDITEQKRMVEALLRSEERYRLIAENAQDLICMVNRQGHYSYVSPSYEHVLGYTTDALLAMRPSDIIHPDDLPTVSGHIMQATVQFRVKCADGSWKWLEGNSFTINWQDEPYTVGIARDITERKEIEMRKDDFLSLASHELRTPVATIKILNQHMQRSARRKGIEAFNSDLTAMDDQINKLTKLIADLLDVSRMQTGKLTFVEEAFDFDALVREIVEQMRKMSEQHKITLCGATHKMIVGDRGRLGQVLINLLTNAIKYSPQADIVNVRISADEPQVFLHVRDYGIGIDPEHHTRLFERFYQVSGGKNMSTSGLGIGLYISSGIIKRHGGKMWVESSKGKGATFSFSLPLNHAVK